MACRDSAADLRLDSAELNQIPPETVTAVQIQAVRDQYQMDWIDWPAHKGAPFYDAEGDGVYSPAFNNNGTPKLFPEADEPGLAGADQVVWLVTNDLNPAVAAVLYGSPPIGLEMQLTLWGYASGPLDDVIFKRFRLIYRGTASTPISATIDSMYFCQWTDPDIGAFTDDLAGYDSTRALGYVYNGSPADAMFSEFGLPPAAAGYDFLQGPLVPSTGDTGIFGFRPRSGFRNLPITTFSFFATGSPDTDPTRGGDYNGTLQWWNLLRGFRPRPESPPQPWLDPNGNVTKFRVTGDPVGGTGWLDETPGDRRLVMASGPFTMALADTQEVIFALVAGLGFDHLSSIESMRISDETAQAAYSTLDFTRAPTAFAAVEFVGSNASIGLLADARAFQARSIVGHLVLASGSQVTESVLLDDGNHGDGGTGDGIFGNTVLLASRSEGLFLNLTIVDGNNFTTRWPHVVANITTAGPLNLLEPNVASDNLNNDGQISPGENVRYGFTIHNTTAFEFQALRITTDQVFDRKVITLASLAAGVQASLLYDPADANSYFAFEVPAAHPDDEFPVIVSILDSRYNVWQDTLVFNVVPFPGVLSFAPIQHVAGRADGSFDVRIISPAVKDHLYAIQGVEAIDAAGTPGFTLKDSTERRVLLQNHPLPDELGHNILPTEGFKILKGTLDYRLIGKEWFFEPVTARWFTGAGEGGFSDWPSQASLLVPFRISRFLPRSR